MAKTAKINVILSYCSRTDIRIVTDYNKDNNTILVLPLVVHNLLSVTDWPTLQELYFKLTDSLGNKDTLTRFAGTHKYLYIKYYSIFTKLYSSVIIIIFFILAINNT